MKDAKMTELKKCFMCDRHIKPGEPFRKTVLVYSPWEKTVKMYYHEACFYGNKDHGTKP
jgi:hypothetical protein